MVPSDNFFSECSQIWDVNSLLSQYYLTFSLKGGKRDVDCDKQIEKAVTAPNCVLKGSWGEGGSGGIRKKLKSEYTAYLESKYRRNDGSSI